MNRERYRLEFLITGVLEVILLPNREPAFIGLRFPLISVGLYILSWCALCIPILSQRKAAEGNARWLLPLRIAFVLLVIGMVLLCVLHVYWQISFQLWWSYLFFPVKILFIDWVCRDGWHKLF